MQDLGYGSGMVGRHGLRRFCGPGTGMGSRAFRVLVLGLREKACRVESRVLKIEVYCFFFFSGADVSV